MWSLLLPHCVAFVCFTAPAVVQGPEDEVKVHMAEDIEEGEVSSDEEGEIKGRQGNSDLLPTYVSISLLYTESDDDGGNEAPPTALPTTTHTRSVPEYGHDTNTTTTREINTHSLRLCIIRCAFMMVKIAKLEVVVLKGSLPRANFRHD